MTDEVAVQTSIQSRHKGPYIGLRPYESEEREIFFGRDQDAQFLCNKIFSARLTLLYSQSGLGKSSILRTLVIPELVKEHARVIYFDAWTGERPTDSLKATLVELASELGIPDADAGAPTLTELIRMVVSIDKKTLVLVLDQFEEFLISHSQNLDPLRRELGGLVRALTLDMHIVISLRQEFLAALEPFRHEILDLFRSTYRLEYLDSKGVRSAIQGPVKHFASTCESKLVEVLIQDLSAKETLGATEGMGPAVELPMLQLVCSQLWEEAQRRGEAVLTLDLYKQLGGAQKILDEYVRSVMPHRWLDKRLTARLMKFLAPPSGLKMSYSIDDLTALTGFNKDRIQTQLKRLSQSLILRIRKFRTGLRYELLHDAFIKVVAPWRDDVLKRFKRIRQVAWVLFGFLIFALIGVALYQFQGRDLIELRLNTEAQLASLRKMPKKDQERLAASRFDSTTGYLLWRIKGSKRLDILRDLLQRYDDLRPSSYGIDRSGIEFIQLPADEEGWPIELYYSSGRNLDESYFMHTWQLMAKNFAESWGIPIPLRLLLKVNPALPKESVDLKVLTGKAPAGGQENSKEMEEVLKLNLPSHEDSVFFSSKDLPSPTQEFFLRFKEEWGPIKKAKNNGPWWIVPRWTLPVWKVSGIPAYDGSGLPAFLLALEMQKNPEFLLHPQAVELLLERFNAIYPQTVAEARAARGVHLREDLIELVRKGKGLSHLHVILDSVAHYPNKSSKDLIKFLDSDLQSSVAILPSTLNGPWKTEPKKKKVQLEKGQATPQIHDAYRKIETWLPEVEPPVRVYLGKALESELLLENELSPLLKERIEILRDEFYRQFGFVIPGVRFRDYSWDMDLGERAFRIEVLNENKLDPKAEAIYPEQGTGLECLIDVLRDRVEDSRIFWLTSEDVLWELMLMDRALHGWLNKQYSLTDLKLLLRAVVQPTVMELDRRATVEVGDPIEVPLEHSLRQLPWLLRSLVFWSMIDDPRDVQKMTQHLRSTQRARIKPSAKLAVNQAVEKSVNEGIRALESGRLVEAKITFSKAIQYGREASIHSFLAAYPNNLQLQMIRNFDELCKDPTNVMLTRSERIEIEDLIGQLDHKTNAERTRRLKICLLASYPEKYRQKRRGLMGELIAEHGKPETWSANEAAWLANQVLSDYDPLKDNSEKKKSAAKFLKSALIRLEDRQAYDAFWNIVALGWKPGPKNWCWDLLDELAKLCPRGNIPLEYAFQLSKREKREDLERALIWVEEAKKINENDIVWLSKAKALHRLGILGDEQKLAEAEHLLLGLLNSSVDLAAKESHLSLIEIRLAQERLDEVEEILNNALKKWPNYSSFYMDKFWIDLLRGDIEGASVTSLEVVDKVGKDSSTLFIAALGLILTGRGQWERMGREFLETDHPYVDYITMMLYATMAGAKKEEAKRLLYQRWAEIDPDTWITRLQGGDAMAWREMLVGYYVGEVKRDEIFGVLEDETSFAESELRNLEIPWKGLITEAYFYDAILAKAQNNTPRMQTSLERVIDISQRNYFEYRMAKFLLANKKDLPK